MGSPDGAPRWQSGLILAWGVVLSLWLVRVYFDLPPDRVHDNHEGHHYALRVLEFRDLLAVGYGSPQWATHFRDGFGSPYFGYYQPGVFYAACAMPWSLPPNHALGLMLLLFSVGGYGSLYALVERRWGVVSGWLAASLLLLAIYSATAIYVRGDLAEYCAMMCVAATALALDTWFRRSSVGAALGLAFGGALIIVMHPAVGLISYAAFGAVLLLALAFPSARRLAVGAGVALAFGVGLAAFYWLPVFREWDLVSPDAAFTDFYNYASNFIGLSDLTDAYRRDTLIPFTLGRLPLGLALLNTALALRFARRGIGYYLGGWALLLALSFMMIEQSRPIWAALEPLQRLQFPWRMQALTTLIVAALAGAVPALPWPYVRALIATAAIGAMFLFSREYTAYDIHPKLAVPTSADSLIGMHVAPDLRDEWLPKGASGDAVLERARLPDGQGSVETSDYRLEQGHLSLTVSTTEGGRVRLPHYAFSGWVATLDGRLTSITADPLGLMLIDVPPDSHGRLDVRFTATPMRRLGLRVAGLMLVALLSSAWGYARWGHYLRLVTSPRP
jgi:hypothetical protein